MLCRWEMMDEVDVGRPGKVLRILGTADNETSVRPPARGLDKQRLQGMLTVGGIGAEIR